MNSDWVPGPCRRGGRGRRRVQGFGKEVRWKQCNKAGRGSGVRGDDRRCLMQDILFFSPIQFVAEAAFELLQFQQRQIRMVNGNGSLAGSSGNIKAVSSNQVGISSFSL